MIAGDNMYLNNNGRNPPHHQHYNDSHDQFEIVYSNNSDDQFINNNHDINHDHVQHQQHQQHLQHLKHHHHANEIIHNNLYRRGTIYCIYNIQNMRHKIHDT